ncbi:MAG TPA: hypothetical protein VH598_04630 [Verrucomicrobiae bacterium]|nr:hypothetical protein [Verrucomicrobiae bacterium]
MHNPRRSILLAVVVLAGVWLIAASGYVIAQRSKMTAEKLRRYVLSIDLGKLSTVERARALAAFADKINALSPEERRNWRRSGEWKAWFAEMTEEEKGRLLDATLPSGFKQMLGSFEQLPDDKRRRALDEAMKQLREGRESALNREPGQDADLYGTNGPPVFSPQLEAKIRTMGLNTFYSESSAETKAEVAPLLEELQRQMESGRLIR